VSQTASSRWPLAAARIFLTACDFEMPFPTSGRRNAVLLFVVLLALGAGMAVWWLWGRAEVRAERLLRSAREQRAAGDLRAAESSALQAVKLNPQLAAAAMLAAECAVAQNELGAALNSARLVTAAHPALRIRAALLEAQINHYRLYHLGEAEQGYREALEGDPENLAANDGLAKLLGLCGRRDEAIPYVLELIDLGRASDLLVMLARDSGALNDPELLSRARQAAPNDPNPLLGMATQAAAEENSGRAIDLLRELLRDHASNVPAQAALGKQLLAAGRFDELAAWSTHLPAGCDASDDVWLARGQLAERANPAPPSAVIWKPPSGRRNRKQRSSVSCNCWKGRADRKSLGDSRNTCKGFRNWSERRTACFSPANARACDRNSFWLAVMKMQGGSGRPGAGRKSPCRWIHKTSRLVRTNNAFGNSPKAFRGG
jgi:thioredoxin-like negative regulator of GroEL